MFIRQTSTRNKSSGESYTTHRLVRSERIADKVRQITLLNLGRNFSVPQSDWPALCQRIEELTFGQATLISGVSAAIEKVAQRYAAQLMARNPTVAETPKPEFREVDISSPELLDPRSVGVEEVALHAMEKLGFIEKLEALGINGTLRAGIIGSVVGRMAKPASELSTHAWLRAESGLGELIDVDYEGMPLMRLYRASDALMRHQDAIENHLFAQASEQLGFSETVTLYDLTNTYFEGGVAGNAKAKRGRSKEKRSDCPLVTLGLVVDGSGFVRRSKTFEGNVSEGKTLEKILTGLGVIPGAMVIMDAGIATEENIEWLATNNFRYLVVSRDRVRQFDVHDAIEIESAAGEPIHLQKKTSEDGKEVRLYCYSEGREQKETAILERFSLAFEAGLQKIADGLKKPHGNKDVKKLLVRIGRLKEKSRGISQHYEIDLKSAENKATEITWKINLVEGTAATHPGVYCLRTNETTWDAEELWRTYSTLTDLESVFRSLKSELGLRPVYHSKEERADGHLLITVLAYQLVQYLRTKLRKAAIPASWATLRGILGLQRRVTVSFQQRDGRTLNIRKSTVAPPELKAIYKALGVSASPGGTKKMLV